jgi:acyl carrier protein/ribosomal protein S18 acetylase RimI-like enzyme
VGELADVVAALAEVLPSADVEACDPGDTLVDLGIDSLTMIQFVAVLERRLGVRLADTDIESLATATLADVSRRIEAARTAGDVGGEPGEGAVSTERCPAVTVRTYRPADRAVLTRICIESSSWGALRELAPLFFLEAYLVDPASCFVAEVGGSVVGYWVGTLDVRRFRRELRHLLVKRARALLGWYARTRAHLAREDRRQFWRRILREPSRIGRRAALARRAVGEVFGGTLVHFQVDRAQAPAGTVFSLARAWTDHLRARGVPGAFLPSVPGGPSALALWERLGFRPLEVPHPDGSRRTWLVAVL